MGKSTTTENKKRERNQGKDKGREKGIVGNKDDGECLSVTTHTPVHIEAHDQAQEKANEHHRKSTNFGERHCSVRNEQEEEEEERKGIFKLFEAKAEMERSSKEEEVKKRYRGVQREYVKKK